MNDWKPYNVIYNVADIKAQYIRVQHVRAGNSLTITIKPLEIDDSESIKFKNEVLILTKDCK